jgi:hypothetical protein
MEFHRVSRSDEDRVHHTDSVDFDVVLEGSVNLIFDNGPHRLGPGDGAVINGVDHGWQTEESGCRMSVVVIATPPLDCPRRGLVDGLEAADFLTSGSLVADPYPYYDELRHRCPVPREPHQDVVMITGYEEALAVYHDSERFSSCTAVTGPFPGFPVPLEATT